MQDIFLVALPPLGAGLQVANILVHFSSQVLGQRSSWHEVFRFGWSEVFELALREVMFRGQMKPEHTEDEKIQINVRHLMLVLPPAPSSSFEQMTHFSSAPFSAFTFRF